jgi:hypothetical protein
MKPTTRRWAILSAASAFLLATPIIHAQTPEPMLVYDDALQPGWNNWSWAKVELSVPTGNAKPIKVQGDPWTALALHHEPFSTKGYTNLVFYVNGGTEGGQTIAVKLMAGGKPLEASYVVTPKTKTWAVVTVPLKDIEGIDKVIDGICFQAQDKPYAPYYVTKIQFE